MASTSNKTTNWLLFVLILLQVIAVTTDFRQLSQGETRSPQDRQRDRLLWRYSEVVIDESTGPPFVVYADRALKSSDSGTHAVLGVYPDFLLLMRIKSAKFKDTETVVMPWTSISHVEGMPLKNFVSSLK